MAHSIRLLSEHTINQIAAGEVINDPSSVVKELIENALDAGALDIHVEILSGGRSCIRITDNGCGMQLDDALLCWERYATSKLRCLDDLFALNTMGFRGEALSSIASIAKCSLLTATEQGNGIGVQIDVEGGKILRSRPAPRSRGTTLEVRDLFYNVPVRRKFQKSPQADSLAVHRMMIQIALAHPEVRFCLVSDQKTLLLASAMPHLTPIEALQERLREVLGDLLGPNMRPIDMPLLDGLEGYSVRGFLAAPIDSKPSRTSQYILLNGRCVSVPFLSMAVKEGYGTSLPPGRYPAFMLHFTLPPDSVDVNVHPQKKEVRLRDEVSLRKALIHAVSKVLYGPMAYTPPTVHLPDSYQPSDLSPLSLEQALSPSKASYEESMPQNAYISPLQCAEEAVDWILREEKTCPVNDVRVTHDARDSYQMFDLHHTPLTLETELELKFSAPKMAPRVLAIVPGYILLDPNSPHFCHKPRGLWLLDQRVAHLRLIHEQLVGNTDHAFLESQILLIPSVVPVSSLQMQLFEVHKALFARSGWQVEAFGPSSVLINAVPQSLLQCSYPDLFLELLDSAQEPLLMEPQAPSLFANRLAQKCLSMQKELSIQEAESLVKTLFAYPEPLRSLCGKPTCLFLDLAQVSTFFKGA